MKLWLTLITQNREQDIEEMLSDTYDYFDGIVAVDHYSTDKTKDILEKYKKNGKIIQLPYCNNHSWSMNGFLFSGVIKNLDWFLILDSSDRINIEWLKKLKNDIISYEKNEIGAVYLDRIFLARYFDGMEFTNGIHWGLSGQRGKCISLLENNLKRDDFIVNTRLKNRNISGIEHPIRYFVEPPCNSQCDLLYSQFGAKILNYHIDQRLLFRIFCQKELNLTPTVNELVNFISNGIKNKNLPNFLIDYIELEVNMQDLVRYYILKQDLLSEIAENRFDWSFKKYYYNGMEHQNKNDGFIGVFNQYKLQLGIPME